MIININKIMNKITLTRPTNKMVANIKKTSVYALNKMGVTIKETSVYAHKTLDNKSIHKI